ncbi:lytic transglycosylase domain-containing protein [Klebsiella sp. RHBSTW-00484]|uniref:lytic transglycosylase domain-containing protein n=1 Tax=unclassified Klebsiella TaxID=2608929 RepID=UPI0015E4A4C0|nr:MULTISPECIES: lytic transglycosylase domain-containing protein [unclassified Klebsiella]MBA7848238.1 lytic transglycosylase domain-containing protein [Klebsiella sp. RHBSTW-00465]QLO35966.1 lytic transglycosylase domain-containing protein [Klebsiella sp. RHBSTW-00484]QLT75482.1 lytic transglycosylase domain-containing protein [Klebsiella sp. RHBSTW-00464]
MSDFPALILQCGNEVSTEVLQRIVSVESSFNPHAIGVVGGRLMRQPVSKEEAVATARYLENAGWNFSMGLAQINRYNLARYGLSYDSVFEPCANLRAAASIYNECFNRAVKTSDYATARLKAFSCYYSGNFTRGFLNDGGQNNSYVQRILNVNVDKNTLAHIAPIPVLSNGDSSNIKKPVYDKAQMHQPQRQKGTNNELDKRRLYKISGKSTSSGVKQLRGE